MGSENSKVNEDLNHLHHELNDLERSNENNDQIISLLNNIYNEMESNEKEMINLFNGRRRNWYNLLKVLRIENTTVKGPSSNILGKLMQHEKSLEILTEIKEVTQEKETKEIIKTSGKSNQRTNLFDSSIKNMDANYMFGSANTEDKKEEFSLEQFCQVLTNMALSSELNIQYEIARSIYALSKYRSKNSSFNDSIPYLVKAGIINSLIVVIQDQNIRTENLANNKITPDDVIKYSLLALKNFSDFEENSIEVSFGKIEESPDGYIKKKIVKSRGSQPLITLMSKSNNIDVEIVEYATHVLASLAQNPICREEILLDNGLDEAIKLFKRTDNQEVKFEIARFFASTCEKEENLLKVRKAGILQDIVDIARYSKKYELKYQYLVTLLTLSLDRENYKFLINANFMELLDGLDFTYVKSEEKLISNVYSFSVFCKKSIVLNISESFLNLARPMIEILKITKSPKVKELATKSVVALSLRRDIQAFLANDIYLNYFLDEISQLLLQNNAELKEMKRLARILTNLFINTSNIFLSGNMRYVQTLSKLKYWALTDTKSSNEKELISDEVTLTMAMLPSKFLESEEIDKIKFAIKHVKSKKRHLATKAAAVYSHLALDLDKRPLLVERNIIDHLIYLLSLDITSVVREAASALANLLHSPDGLSLWLKFDSNRLSIDASGNTVLLITGKPKNLPKDKGLYNNWGVLFDVNDVMEIPGEGLKLEDKFTVCFWFIFPLPAKGKKFHTLFQGDKGYGGHFAIDERGEYFGVFDEEEGKFKRGNDKKANFTMGWNHMAIIYENSKKLVSFYLNGDSVGGAIEASCKAPIRFIGNSKKGDEPFGVISDLRIYNLGQPSKAIKEMSFYDPEKEPKKYPDYYHQLVFKTKRIPDIVHSLNNIFSEAQYEVCRVISILATKHECKIEMIKSEVFDKLSYLVNDINLLLRMEASKCMLHLN